MVKLSAQNDCYRIVEIKNEYDDGINSRDPNGYRTEYRRDYARVLHSSSFRRLGNKTQLFPGNESDFFRNRLTHSLEVAQISRSIAMKFKKREASGADFIEPDVCEVAGLMHDIGHPPFGHNGERALDDCMKQCGGFEGNAQTIHIITRLEKKESPKNGTVFDEQGKDLRCGLNLTVRSIASALKYDSLIEPYREDGNNFQKGYYECDEPVIKTVKEKIIGNGDFRPFKTIECSIMDIADDIAYSTYDLEDAFKAGFLSPIKIMSAEPEIYKQIAEKIGKGCNPETCRSAIIDLFKEISNMKEPVDNQRELNKRDSLYESKTVAIFLDFYSSSEELASNGYFRSRFSSYLVSKFINGVSLKYNADYPILSGISVDPDILLLINIFKYFSYICLINSSRLKVVENRGYDIIKKMFEKLTRPDGYKLLPEDYQSLYNQAVTEAGKKRIVCDFIAGMTDRYAIEFYSRLFSENPQTIFKPL